MSERINRTANHYLVLMNFTDYDAARKAMRDYKGIILTDAPQVIQVRDPYGEVRARELLQMLVKTFEARDAAIVVEDLYGR